jgi:hypothetical protein
MSLARDHNAICLSYLEKTRVSERRCETICRELTTLWMFKVLRYDYHKLVKGRRRVEIEMQIAQF